MTHPFRILLTIPALMLAIGTGACIQDTGDLPEGAEKELIDGPNAEPLASSSCLSQCASERFDCRIGCISLPAPGNIDCLDDCAYDYHLCIQGSYSLSQSGTSICHLDIDQHLFDVDIEFYVADTYSDTTCGNADKFRKRRIATVSCSNWTGLTSPSTCTNRVNNKLAQLAAQGYTPTFTQPDTDQCPTPRPKGLNRREPAVRSVSQAPRP